MIPNACPHCGHRTSPDKEAQYCIWCGKPVEHSFAVVLDKVLDDAERQALKDAVKPSNR